MQTLALLAVPVMAIIVMWLGLRITSRYRSTPCPTTLAFLLDNPFTANYHAAILSRLELSPGLHVLDAGCGPGLLTVPIAKLVGSGGRVCALDVQAGMLARARARAEQAGVSNVDFVCAPLGAGTLPSRKFDRALLATVLGEIPEPLAALQEIYASLKPGGFLSVTEALPDPDHLSVSRVSNLGLQAGFRVGKKHGNWFVYTVNLEKPSEGE